MFDFRSIYSVSSYNLLCTYDAYRWSSWLCDRIVSMLHLPNLLVLLPIWYRLALAFSSTCNSCANWLLRLYAVIRLISSQYNGAIRIGLIFVSIADMILWANGKTSCNPIKLTLCLKILYNRWVTDSLFLRTSSWFFCRILRYWPAFLIDELNWVVRIMFSLANRLAQNRLLSSKFNAKEQ